MKKYEFTNKLCEKVLHGTAGIITGSDGKAYLPGLRLDIIEERSRFDVKLTDHDGDVVVTTTFPKQPFSSILTLDGIALEVSLGLPITVNECKFTLPRNQVEITETTTYGWECPECGAGNSEGDKSPKHEKVVCCYACGKAFWPTMN